MAAPRIRPRTPEDRAALLDLIVELQEHERRLHDGLRPGAEIADSYLAYLERHIFDGQGELLVSDLCVTSSHRGRGIAQALLAAEAYARRMGAARLRVEVLSANREAAGAYRRFGFEPFVSMIEKRIG